MLYCEICNIYSFFTEINLNIDTNTFLKLPRIPLKNSEYFKLETNVIKY